MLVRLTGLKFPLARATTTDLLWNLTGSVMYEDCTQIVNHLAGGGHSYIHLSSINKELLEFFNAEEVDSVMGNVDAPIPSKSLKLFRCTVGPKKNTGKNGKVNGRRAIEIVVLTFGEDEAVDYFMNHIESLGQLYTHVKREHVLCEELTGPFESGYIISTSP